MLDRESSPRIGLSQIARASALAALIVVVPLLAFLLWFWRFAPLPQLTGATFAAITAFGIGSVYLALVAGYIAVAVALRAVGLLSRRSLLVVSGLVSLAIGWQFLVWAREAQSSFLEQAQSFALPAGIYFVVFTVMSYLWWHIARGTATTSASVPSAPAG